MDKKQKDDLLVLGWLLALITLAFLAFACTKIPPIPWPRPTPTPFPSPSPEPSPTPTPAPTPQPTPFPSPCIESPIPETPVPLVQSGACSGGATRYPFELGGSICLAESSCPWPAERCGTCQTVESFINYNARWGRVFLARGYATLHDGPDEKLQLDAYGRVYQAGIQPVREFGDWTYLNLCTPKRKVCPSPEPTTPPTPPPPGPTPNPGPTPASCPAFACIDGKVHLAAGPGGMLPYPTACVGCRVVLDSTPHFERCLPVWQCGEDHHGPCTFEGHPAHQSHTCDPNCSEANPCLAWRHCGDPRGPKWHKVSGPNVEWSVQEPGPDRGYQVMIQTPFSGTYVWQVCAASPRDELGVPVRVEQECGTISFEVR